MSRGLPELSKAEWLVMHVCWKKGRCTAREIYERAVKKRDWKYQTVKTMLDRLADKGYLHRDKLGPLCLYEPVASRSQAVGQALDSFVGTVLDNTFAPLLLRLAKERKLTQDEIESLKELIEGHE